MTRDEAIAKGAAVELLERGAPTSYSNRVVAHNFVAIAEALGILKLDEPKNINERYQEVFAEWEKHGGLLYDRLLAAGLKITEK